MTGYALPKGLYIQPSNHPTIQPGRDRITPLLLCQTSFFKQNLHALALCYQWADWHAKERKFIYLALIFVQEQDFLFLAVVH